MHQSQKEISLVELVLMLMLVGIPSWILGFIFLGWLGNAAVTLWAKMKGIKLKSPGQDMLLHILAPLVGLLPGVPGAAGQIIILYFVNKVERVAPRLTGAKTV